MIYRQVIPPAPAYLGLNLFLKGTQVNPKNGTGKKEKPKVDVKVKVERKKLLYVKSARDLLNGEIERTPILSPRSLMIDFSDCNENSSLMTVNSGKGKPIQAITTLGRSNKENMIRSDKFLGGRISSYLPLSRYSSKLSNIKEHPPSTRKCLSKTIDSSRRHTSCGPKLIAAAPKGDDVEKAETNSSDQSKIKCVGNKCVADAEVTDSAAESTKSSPRKQETPSIVNIRAKLKPVNVISKSARVPTLNSRDRLTTAPSEYRKNLAQSNLELNKMPPRLPINSSYYNSHFYAVGLSLRAWRSKYSRNGPPSAAIGSSQKRKII